MRITEMGVVRKHDAHFVKDPLAGIEFNRISLSL